MDALFGLVAGLLVVAGVCLYVLRRMRPLQRYREREKTLHHRQTERLRYVVPVGQDPADIVAALQLAGYESTSESTGAHQTVLIACRAADPRERERVRDVIRSACTSTSVGGIRVPAEVRFIDEGPAGPA